MNNTPSSRCLKILIIPSERRQMILLVYVIRSCLLCQSLINSASFDYGIWIFLLTVVHSTGHRLPVSCWQWHEVQAPLPRSSEGHGRVWKRTCHYRAWSQSTRCYSSCTAAQECIKACRTLHIPQYFPCPTRETQIHHHEGRFWISVCVSRRKSAHAISWRFQGQFSLIFVQMCCDFQMLFFGTCATMCFLCAFFWLVHN